MNFMPEKQAELGEGSLLGRVPVIHCGAGVKYPVGYRSSYKDSRDDDGKIPAVDSAYPEEVIGRFLGSNPPAG